MKRLLRVLSVTLAVLIFACGSFSTAAAARSHAEHRTEHETSIHINRAENNTIPTRQGDGPPGEGPPGEGPPGEGPPGEGPPSGDQQGENPPPESKPSTTPSGTQPSTTPSGTKPPSTTQPSSNQGGDDVDSSSAAVIIIAIIVVIIGTVIALVAVNNKKNRNVYQAPPIPPAAPIPPAPVRPAPSAAPVAPAPSPKRFPQAVIKGTKGVMANRTYPINGNLLIGRNAQKCNVAYPVDTQGVSAVHCQIREVNGGFEIIDRGSSNGTFLGSGQRLVPNVPTFLPDGTFFYLGSAEQLFQIKY